MSLLIGLFLLVGFVVLLLLAGFERSRAFDAMSPEERNAWLRRTPFGWRIPE